MRASTQMVPQNNHVFPSLEAFSPKRRTLENRQVSKVNRLFKLGSFAAPRSLPFGTAIFPVTVPVLRQIRSTLWLIGFVVAASPAAGGWGADAQRVTIPREHHAWARFTPGSWSKVRKWTEDLDEQGKVKSASTTETKTTLIGIDESGCTLQLEVTVEVAGKRFVAQPRQVRVGFDGGTNGARNGIPQGGRSIPGPGRQGDQLCDSGKHVDQRRHTSRQPLALQRLGSALHSPPRDRDHQPRWQTDFGSRRRWMRWPWTCRRRS